MPKNKLVANNNLKKENRTIIQFCTVCPDMDNQTTADNTHTSHQHSKINMTANGTKRQFGFSLFSFCPMFASTPPVAYTVPSTYPTHIITGCCGSHTLQASLVVLQPAARRRHVALILQSFYHKIPHQFFRVHHQMPQLAITCQDHHRSVHKLKIKTVYWRLRD